MSQETIPVWQSMRTSETQQIEEVLRREFPLTDAYRYNSASIRLRIIDERFKGLSDSKRDDLVEPLIETLSEEIQRDIITLMTFVPSELETSTRAQLMNIEFEEPSPTSL